MTHDWSSTCKIHVRSFVLHQQKKRTVTWEEKRVTVCEMMCFEMTPLSRRRRTESDGNVSNNKRGHVSKIKGILSSLEMSECGWESVLESLFRESF